jgi:predicted naringenin-chalcone synthase
VKRAFLQGNAAKASMADWNEASWMLHTGGRGIVDGVEARLGLREEKLAATREVMRQYGNTRSSSIFLVMDEMRTRSAEQGLSTAGEGLELGMVIAFGPGLTLEAMHAAPRGTCNCKHLATTPLHIIKQGTSLKACSSGTE